MSKFVLQSISKSTVQTSSTCFLGLTPSGLLKVAFPFDAVTHAQLRKFRPRGVWRGPKRGWEFPLSAAESLKEHFGKRFLVQDELSEWLTLIKDPLPPMPPVSQLIDKGDFNKVLADGRKPLPHQILGAKWLCEKRGALLADEMGLGKTLTALLAARAMFRATKIRILVVAPVGLHSHWLQEANALGLSIDLKSWALLPRNLPDSGTLLLVDEAHFAQSLKSQRTQSLLRLARHPRLRAIWMLTGTPMKNGRPIELYPLLAAMDHPLARDQVHYEKFFCNGHWRERDGRRIWDCKGATNLQELNRLVHPLILNRRKDKLLGLPPKIRQLHEVKLSKAETLGFEHRLSIVIEDFRERVEANLVNSAAESLIVLSTIRQISSEFKLPAVSNLIEELLAIERPIVLFSSFIKPLKLLQKRLGGELLTGAKTMKEREMIVNNFQQGKSNLLLTTYGTGGLGFTLHRARDVVLLDRPWTPGDVSQAEDRCHRLGMDGPLKSHWPQLGFADQLVDQLVATKAERINVILGFKPITIDRNSLPNMVKQCILKVSI